MGVAQLLPAYAGLLLERELEQLGKLLGDVERPFVLVSGGAKVDDKLGVLRNLGGRADAVLIGGKMAEQLRDENPLGVRRSSCPSTSSPPPSSSEDAESKVVAVRRASGRLARARHRARDARRRSRREIAEARTVFWNGPMGVFEWPRFAEGTRAVAEAVARRGRRTPSSAAPTRSAR